MDASQSVSNKIHNTTKSDEVHVRRAYLWQQRCGWSVSGTVPPQRTGSLLRLHSWPSSQKRTETLDYTSRALLLGPAASSEQPGREERFDKEHETNIALICWLPRTDLNRGSSENCNYTWLDNNKIVCVQINCWYRHKTRGFWKHAPGCWARWNQQLFVVYNCWKTV